jgi:hypothetical protein
MPYRVGFATLLLASVAFVPFANAQQASTTRIEPRPVYGAIITIEEGVRVFRPLPPERHVIINPGGSTPLNLSFNETRIQHESRAVSHHSHTHRYPHSPHYRSFIPATSLD